MLRYLFNVILVLTVAVTISATSWADDKNEDEILRRSILEEAAGFNPNPPQSSFPAPFVRSGTPIVNPVNSPAVSTGYYFVDSRDDAGNFWFPNPDWVYDTLENPGLWFDIISGPNQYPQSFWQSAVQKPNGLRYFRNPGNMTDSVDNAIAGPIPIQFDFYFNGIRYDSFYVSTNGIIALTNRRYFYNDYGVRTIPIGATNCYDPMSMDWFRSYPGSGFRQRKPTADTTGINDPTPDDFGYLYSVLGGATTPSNGGIRQDGGDLNTLNTNNKTAVIAPFFGALHLSQWNATGNYTDNWGRVKFRRSLNQDKLIIWFMNVQPYGTWNSPNGTYNFPLNLRPTDQNYIGASAQVVLNRIDSSIQINYGTFDGLAIIGGRPTDALVLFRYNTTVGVRGFARHVNYNNGGLTDWAYYPWAPPSANGEYEQYTHYFSKYQIRSADFPRSGMAIKFKQWKNVLRVCDIRWRIRNPQPTASLDFTQEVSSSLSKGYEFLAGDARLGALQPVAIIENLSNDIQGPQGVNFTPQQLQFRARFKIVNEASLQTTYTSLIPVDTYCLSLPVSQAEDCVEDPYVLVRYVDANLTGNNYTATTKSFPGSANLIGIPPYGFVQIYFRPFEMNENSNSHIGRLKAYVIAEPFHPATGEALGEQWPFDDTTTVTFFVVRRINDEFYDDFNGFHIIGNVPMPSTLKWVNIDGEVSSGDIVSNYPLPPRGDFAAANNDDFNFVSPNFKNQILKSPVMRLNRTTLLGSNAADVTPVYAGSPTPGGDEVRSFPINLLHTASRKTLGSVLSLSVQRSVKRNDWERGWSSNLLTAPEIYTEYNGNALLNPWNLSNSQVSKYPDQLRIEFAKDFAESNGLFTIVNIPAANWRYHPYKTQPTVTNMSAYAIFGGGGALRGFDETNKDSALLQPTTTVENGLRWDPFDDGIDFEYKRIYIPIPDTFINAPGEGARNFRFRIKVAAYDNQVCQTCIVDDDDPFFVDNVKISLPREVPDIEISTVKAIWPYTMAPRSQAINIPIRIKVTNNSSIYAPSFVIKLQIYRESDFNPNDDEAIRTKPIYCRTSSLPFLPAGKVKDFQMPNWDARLAGSGNYILRGTVIVANGDDDPRNDITWSNFELRLGDVFAYDPISATINNVQDNDFTGISGKGLTLWASAYGGTGNRAAYTTGSYDEIVHGTGNLYAAGNGQIAVRFQLYQADTIKGYKVYFANLNMAPDQISIRIYDNSNGTPGQEFTNTIIYRQRLWDDVRQNYYASEYVTYLVDNPIVLPAGTYWAAIAQLANTGIQLGATKSRSGLRTTYVYIANPGNINSAGSYSLGASGVNLACDKAFRQLNVYDNLINDNFFCVENTVGSGGWLQFFPTMGNRLMRTWTLRHNYRI
jgi:hypothetical protein